MTNERILEITNESKRFWREMRKRRAVLSETSMTVALVTGRGERCKHRDKTMFNRFLTKWDLVCTKR